MWSHSAILTALDSELDAVRTIGTEKFGIQWEPCQSPKSRRHYFVGQLRNGIKVAAVTANKAGQLPASNLARDVIEDIHPKWLFLSGFAATIDPDNVKLGDVVVAQHIFDISAGKQTPKGAKLDLHSYPPDDGLQAKLRIADHRELAKHIIVEHPEGDTKHKPTVHTVDTLCGSKVVADKKYRSRIKDASGRKAKALEMEGYGVAYALNSFPKELQTTEFAMVRACY